MTAALARVMAHDFMHGLMADGSRKLELLLSADTLPLNTAVSGVVQAIEQEIGVRKRKIGALRERRAEALGLDTPRKLQVSGLRGEASAANGLYIADGLRNFWGRALYVQMPASSGQHLSSLHYLYYDCRHDASAVRQWTDGCWVIGPDLNSERCTAFVNDEHNDLLFPPPTDLSTKSQKWMVFDTVHNRWAAAPGNHCASFLIKSVEEEETMLEYIDMCIQDQQHILDSFQTAINGKGSDFQETVKLTLRVECVQDELVERKAFIAWRTIYKLKVICSCDYILTEIA
eukprot:COSAG01_NODE_1158_length_11469_cov_101.645646_4_plen_288_part_00